MKKIDEEFLHFLWKHQQLAGIIIESACESEIKVIDPGMHNHDAGPDFFNSRICINDTIWAGNVELHINASDWIRHGHTEDPFYDSVILHVVYFNDCEITHADGNPIPTAVIRFPTLMWDRYADLQHNGKWIPCQEYLAEIEPVHVAQWTSSLMTEKLIERSAFLKKNMDDVDGHWDALLSRILFRSFGLPINTTPFEMLSLLIPYPTLLRFKNDLFRLEALLFGQAGMLSTAVPHDHYVESLRFEFARISPRLEGSVIPGHIWKYLRMRPASFPSIRIAQLASLIKNCFPLHQYFETLPDINELMILFGVKAGDYWNTHYQLGKTSSNHPKYIGKSFIRLLIVNCVIPYMFHYGKTISKQHVCDYAVSLLEQLPAEHNAVLKKWGKFGMNPANAFESQAFLHLHKHYCRQERCLECQFGNNLILDGKNKK